MKRPAWRGVILGVPVVIIFVGPVGLLGKPLEQVSQESMTQDRVAPVPNEGQAQRDGATIGRTTAYVFFWHLARRYMPYARYVL